MMVFIKYIFLLALLVFSAQARAQECEVPDKDVICPDLWELKAYKDNKSLKMLTSGYDEWIFRTSTDFQNDFELNGAGLTRFTRLQKAFKEQNIELVITLLPTRGMMHHLVVADCEHDHTVALESYNKLAQQLHDIGISVATAPIENYSEDFFYKRDHHWRYFGAKTMAKAVAHQVKQLPAYNDIKKDKFVTEIMGQDIHQGTFAKFVNEKCGSDIQGESIDLYKTVLKSIGDDDLFGENTLPEIVLIGTSNSTQSASKANFDGFLREYIGTDIDNRSISGGGANTAFYQWLSSSDYKNNKPKIVIWEIPIYQNFDSGSFFRQLIPAVYGDCIEKEITTESIDVAETINLFNSVWKHESLKTGLYTKLTFTDKNLRKFRTVTKYENGKKDILGLRRSKFYKSDGIFFYEFNQDKDIGIESFSLSLPENITGTVKASLCAYPSLD